MINRKRDFEKNVETQLKAAIDYETGAACSEYHSASFVSYSESGGDYTINYILENGVYNGMNMYVCSIE